MTIKEFVMEAELFPYSQENFNLMKEAGEIELMQRHLENTRFQLDEVSLVLEGTGYTPVAGFFTESYSEDETVLLESKLGEKLNKFKSGIKRIWTKIITALISFWNNIKNRGKNLKEKADGIINDLKTVEAKRVTPEIKDEIAALVDKAITVSKAPISKKQTTRLNIGKFLVSTDATVEAMLIAALSDTTIRCDITKDYAFALAQSQLEGFFDTVPNTVGKGVGDLQSKLDKFVAMNAKKGIQVHVDEESIQSLITKLQAAGDAIAKQQMEDADREQAAGGYADNEANTSYNKILEEAHRVSADSIKLYTAIQKYRETVVNGLGPIVSKLKKQASEK